MSNKVKAYIARDANGVCRIYCQRAPRKWWFELGRHAATDFMFEAALSSGTISWNQKIKDPGKLFQ